MILAFYLLVLLALALNAPPTVWDPGAREFVVILGLVGAWRYGWNLVHFGRALVYRRLVFPRWRGAVSRLVAAHAAGKGGPDPRPSEVYCIVTSYRIQAETTAACYHALLDELLRYGRPAVVVGSIVEMADERLIKRLFQTRRLPPHIRLALVRLPAAGKRPALATALRCVSRLRPAADAAVIVMDGDAVLTPGTLERSLPFLSLVPRLGGLTTDEDAVVAGGPLLTAWHRLRFAQRHMLMSSLGLSKRLLTLTGRMSVVRVEVATAPSFIGMVAEDEIDHWRLGRIPLLTGEDKSTWLWLLERGYDMMYVPDVRILTIEHPPARGFVRASTQLMLRWFGNMFRASGRAIALGPRRVGLFLWWCLIDQRVSIWTPLIGPVVILIGSVSYSPVLLYVYVTWVMFTRLVQTLGLLSVRDHLDGRWPLLIYYNQVYGALIKSFVFFRLDRQRWTRQRIALRRAVDPRAARWREIGSAYVHGLALASLVCGLAFLSGVLTMPRVVTLAGLF
jgi:glycosyltransferase Alg8